MTRAWKVFFALLVSTLVASLAGCGPVTAVTAEQWVALQESADPNVQALLDAGYTPVAWVRPDEMAPQYLLWKDCGSRRAEVCNHQVIRPGIDRPFVYLQTNGTGGVAAFTGVFAFKYSLVDVGMVTCVPKPAPKIKMEHFSIWDDITWDPLNETGTVTHDGVTWKCSKAV